MRKNILIVGGGQAGCMVAVALRQKKYSGAITLLTEEKHLPYQRPPLSKKFLTDSIEPERIYLKPYSYFQRNNISILTDSKVEKINRRKKLVELVDGEKHLYDFLVIASGSLLNKIDSSCNQKNVFYLRNIEDAIQIKNILNNKKDLAVIGGGYIGLEVAAAASKKNLNITLIETQSRVMIRTLCYETANFLEMKHRKNGVKFLFNESIKGIRNYRSKKRIMLSDQSYLDVDAVIIGIGIKPNIGFAVNSGIKCGDGILVDENGRTSDPDIFAAGDCTNHPNKIYGRRLRIESVHNAVEQAKTVASSIIGGNKPYNQVPWFWTEQYDIKLQIAGISEYFDNHLVRGNTDDEKFSVFYFLKDRLIAIDAINDQKTFALGKKIIAINEPIPQQFFKDGDLNLKKYLGTYKT